MALVAVVALASFWPVTGEAASFVKTLTTIAIAGMFFFYGARLEREALVTALVNWKLHLTVLAMTYVLFPVLGLTLMFAVGDALPENLRDGFIFLCVLPSTVQSSIAFTSIARGNVAAAVCAASTSNLLGVALTPVLVGLLIHATDGGVSLEAIKAIVIQLLLPFLAGQLLRPVVGGWVQRWQPILNKADRGAILLVVYGAFSAAVVNGLWGEISAFDLVLLVALSAVLLGAVLLISTYASRGLKFAREDEIAIVFCGSKKSLATGVPMAGVLFTAASAGFVVLPLMIFHQMQLLACAVLAQRYAKQTP
ncbi:MAG: bile acid:sodium symporter [Rhodospirillaceae bacterium]|nr:bile acid:sodium symporter [Rhodospirillaceae bacterium]